MLNFTLSRLAQLVFRCVLPSLPYPKSPRNRTRRQHRYDYYRPLRDEILAHERDPRYDGLQKLKRVDAVAREWLVHRRHSFFSRRFPVLSTPTSDPSSCPSPLFSDRSIPHSQPHPYNTHPQTSSPPVFPQAKRVALMLALTRPILGKGEKLIRSLTTPPNFTMTRSHQSYQSTRQRGNQRPSTRGFGSTTSTFTTPYTLASMDTAHTAIPPLKVPRHHIPNHNRHPHPKFITPATQ